MTDQTKTANPVRKGNSEGVCHAVAMAMMHVGNLDKEQRADVILAALDAFKTSLIDDLTHAVGCGEVPDEEVVARIVDLGTTMEQVRRERISRFANLCEMLKPHANIVVEFADGDKTKH